MEREMCTYLDWELTVDNPILSNFEDAIKVDFGEDKDRRSYPNYPTTFVSKRAARAEQSNPVKSPTARSHWHLPVLAVSDLMCWKWLGGKKFVEYVCQVDTSVLKNIL